MEQTRKFSGYSVAIGCAIVVFCTQGSLGTFGIFLPNIISTQGWSVAAVSLMATCASIACFVTNTVMSKVIRKIGAKNTMLLGAILCGLHYVIYGTANSIIQIYIGGTLGGISMGLATSATLSIILTRWFVKDRKKIIGNAMLTMGFGGAAFSFLCGQMIELFGWRTAYIVVAGILLVVTIPITLLMVKDSPAKYGQLPLGSDKQVEETGDAAKKKGKITETKIPAFWLLWIGLFFYGLLTPSLSHHLSNAMQGNGIAPVTAANLVSVTKVVAALGFILSGQVAHKLGTKGSILFMGAGSVICAVSVIFVSADAYMWIVLMCISYGVSYPTFHITSSFTTMDAFGPERYGVLLGVFQGGAIFGSAFASLVTGAIKDVTGSYTGAMIFLAATTILGIGLIFIALNIAPHAKKVKAQPQNASE